MNVLGLFLLLFILAAASIGLFVIAGTTNTTPVDSYGTTASQQTNLSVGNTTSIMKAGMAAVPWIAFVIVVLIIVGVFLWAREQGHGYNRSRY